MKGKAPCISNLNTWRIWAIVCTLHPLYPSIHSLSSWWVSEGLDVVTKYKILSSTVCIIFLMYILIWLFFIRLQTHHHETYPLCFLVFYSKSSFVILIWVAIATSSPWEEFPPTTMITAKQIMCHTIIKIYKGMAANLSLTVLNLDPNPISNVAYLL
jgi:hypothetical protein